MNKKYRLNYDWNRYEKGQMFREDDNGKITYQSNGCWYCLFRQEINLLLLSGALTEIAEAELPVELPSELRCLSGLSVAEEAIIDNQNAIIRYLKEKK